MTKKQRAVLLTVLITAFITPFMGSSMNLCVINIESEFHTSAAIVGWVITSFTMATVALSIPMGKIADVTGRKRILLMGISGYVILFFLILFSRNIWMVLIFRALQGASASMVFATNNAVLLNAFPDNVRGRMLGISVTSTYLGLSLGPVLGGILNHTFGWRSIFVVSLVIAIIAWISCLRGVDNDKQQPAQTNHFDLGGNLLFIIAVTVSLYALTNLSIQRFSWVLLIIGLGFGVLFVRRETRAADPMIRISMFTKDAAFTLSNIAALLNYGATFAITYLVSIYLQSIKGFTSQTAGMILLFMPVLQAIFSSFMGRLSDRIAPYKLATTGMALNTVGLVFLIFVKEDTPLILICILLAYLGFGFALFSSPNTNAVLSCVSHEEYGIANAVLSTMRTMGQTISMSVVTIIVGITMGSAALNEAAPETLLRTMHIAFFVFVILSIAGTFMSLKRKSA
ncbi:MAG: MFS transporter [Lachnospiraceae bacterium]|nr:MFS transporter [Lachnospiraceae bacterium]